MKIFWSWQSDNDEKCGRYFIRDVLTQVAAGLNQPGSVDDAERDGNVDRVEVDYDTKGVSGSPPIAETILRKIREAGVFVADVTPVGRTEEGGKPLANPNVMIELGYALSVLGHERIVLVMNRACHGTPDNLPFDLRHGRWPISYDLDPNAPAEAKKEQKNQLTLALRGAIAPALVTAMTQARDDLRLSNPQPEFVVKLTAPTGGYLPATISQTVTDLGVPTLDDIKIKYPKLPMPDVDREPVRRPALTALTFPLHSPIPTALWTKHQVENYNQRLQIYYGQYQTYLDQLGDYHKQKLRSLTVCLELTNTGTRPGTNIDVELDVPQGLLLFDPEKLPEAPNAPYPPPLDPEPVASARLVPFHERIKKLTPPSNTHWTRIDPEGRHVRFHLTALKHGYSSTSNPFVLVFATAQDIGSKTLSYMVSSNETPTSQDGETLLHVAAAADD